MNGNTSKLKGPGYGESPSGITRFSSAQSDTSRRFISVGISARNLGFSLSRKSSRASAVKILLFIFSAFALQLFNLSVYDLVNLCLGPFDGSLNCLFDLSLDFIAQLFVSAPDPVSDL